MGEYSTRKKPKLTKTPLGMFPSVYAILSETSDKSTIDKWIKEVGWLEAESVRRKAIERGKELDNQIENYIDTGEIVESDYFAQSLTVISEFVEHRLQMNVYHPEGYAGRFDYLGTTAEGRKVLIEWKTAEQVKPDGWTLDARLQAVAYLKAAEYTLKEPISEARVIYCIKGRQIPRTHHIEGMEIERLWEQFQDRLDRYRQLYEEDF